MDFYGKKERSRDAFITTSGHPSALTFFRTNNLTNVSQHFMNTLMNNQPMAASGSPQTLGAAGSSILCETADWKMD